MWKVNFDARVGRIEGFTRWKEKRNVGNSTTKKWDIFKINLFITASIYNIHMKSLLTWRVSHSHKEVVTRWGGAQPGGGAGPGGRPVEGRGAGGRPVEGARRGHAVTDAAQAGAQAQHQAGRATRLKYRERGLVNRKWKITQLLCCDLRGVWQ